jgi:hypothetical protein
VDTVQNNFPRDVIRAPQAVLVDTDPVAWNKIALGVAVVPTAMPTGGRLFKPIGNGYCKYWQMLVGRTYAAAAQLHVASLGLGVELWNSAYENSDLIKIRELVRAHFTTMVGSSGKMAMPNMARIISALYAGIHGRQPAVNSAGLTPFENRYPCFRLGAINQAGTAFFEVSPIWLTDQWIYTHAKVVPRRFSPIPPSLGQDSMTGLATDTMDLTIIDATHFGNPTIKQLNVINQYSTRDMTDDEYWNLRVCYLLFGSYVIGANPFPDYVPTGVFKFLGGVNYPTAGFAAPVALDIIKPAPTPIDPAWGTNTLAFGLSSGSTMWFPLIDASGAVPYLADVRATAITASQVLTGMRRVQVEVAMRAGTTPASALQLGGDKGGSSVWSFAFEKKLSMAGEPETYAGDGTAEAGTLELLTQPGSMGRDSGGAATGTTTESALNSNP